MKQISVDIKTNGAIPTADFIGVDVDAVAKIKIKTDPDGIKKAMGNFLNMSEDQIIEALTDSLQGNMREVIGTIPLKTSVMIENVLVMKYKKSTNRHERTWY